MSTIDELFLNNKNTSNNSDFERINYLYRFNSIQEFFCFTTELYPVILWKIEAQEDYIRANELKKRAYFIKLKDDFNNTDLCAYHITNSQILSFLDTMSIMFKILNMLDSKYKNDIKIIMEYKSEYYSTSKRADYLIIFKDIVIVIEFGRTTKENYRRTKVSKNRQVNRYRRIIADKLGSSMKVFSTSIVYFADDNNIDAINDAIQFINNKCSESI